MLVKNNRFDFNGESCNRKLARFINILVLLWISLDCQQCHPSSTTESVVTDPCRQRNVIEIHSDKGYLDSAEEKLNTTRDCQLWRIQASPNSTITVSIDLLETYNIHQDNDCGQGTQLTLGPLPLWTVCKLNSFSTVYRSNRDHIWVRFSVQATGQQPWTKPRFFFTFISSASDYCETRCDDGTCIYRKWRCNGVAECQDASDEQFCNFRIIPSVPGGSVHNTTISPRRASTRPAPSRPSPTPDCIKCYLTAMSVTACVPPHHLCDGIPHCRYGLDESHTICEGRNTSDKKTTPPSQKCEYQEVWCYVSRLHKYACLHNMHRCDGLPDCRDGEDERPSECGNQACNRRLEEPTGWFTSPNYPRFYPRNSHCSWVIHQQASDPSSTIQLRLVVFNLAMTPETDYVKIYDGPDNTYRLLMTLYGSETAFMLESSSNWLNVVFVSDNYDEFTGFNFTYQVKGECFLNQAKCIGEKNCYDITNRCNGVWDCVERGSDEMGCGHCAHGEYSCGLDTDQCYHPSERCNGIARCSNSADEKSCTSVQCGTHNGTFLCDNKRCIYESWTCDQRDDCGDSSDEQYCSGNTKRVIIAAICGSMICGLLLVILLGCSCKLYALRTMDRHPGVRQETPMNRLYAELIRRRAPPPYHEAMLTSRNFDEVQQEYLQQMQERQRANSRRSRRSRRNGRRGSRNTADESSQGSTNTNDVEANATTGDNESRGVTSLATVMEENENHVNIERQSSTAELLPNDSDSDSSSTDTDLDPGPHSNNREGQHVDQSDDDGEENEDDDDDDDDENILVSRTLSANWARTPNGDDTSDEACILDEDMGRDSGSLTMEMTSDLHHGQSDNSSTDTASASVDSLDLADIQSTSNVSSRKLSDDEKDSSDQCDEENSRNSTPKPDTRQTHDVIIHDGNDIPQSTSQNSLNSVGSETFRDNNVPLLPLHSSSNDL